MLNIVLLFLISFSISSPVYMYIEREYEDSDCSILTQKSYKPLGYCVKTSFTETTKYERVPGKKVSYLVKKCDSLCNNCEKSGDLRGYPDYYDNYCHGVALNPVVYKKVSIELVDGIPLKSDEVAEFRYPNTQGDTKKNFHILLVYKTLTCLWLNGKWRRWISYDGYSRLFGFSTYSGCDSAKFMYYGVFNEMDVHMDGIKYYSGDAMIVDWDYCEYSGRKYNYELEDCVGNDKY